MAFLKDDLLMGFKTLVPHEFDFEYHTGVVSFVWNDEISVSKIEITFSHYFPNSVSFTGISCSLRFESIESILAESSQYLSIDYSSASTIRYSFNNDVENSIVGLRVESVEDFQEALRVFNYLIIDKCLPTIKTFRNLYHIADFLSNLKPQEVVPYIQGAKLFVKTILILKEANHPSYMEKRDEFYEVLKKQAEKKEVYAEQLRLFEYMFLNDLS